MNDTLTISLTHLRFLAYHGLYAEEKKIGAEFEVNLFASFNPTGAINDLHDSINYTSLYQLLKKEMQKPRELLETFLIEVSEIIHSTYPSVKKIEFSITKLQAPIAGFQGNVVVKYSKEY